MRLKKKRLPKLTRLEKMTKGLMIPGDEVKSKFTVREVEVKGRALFLHSRILRKDSFVLEYEGDVITHDDAELREKIYELNEEGCYILFFRFQGRRLAIDATRRFDSYARYLNHSKEPNIRFHPPLLLDLTGQGVPRIAAYALRDIHEGEEIVFDYGISDGGISWLSNKKRCLTSELSDTSNDNDTSSSSDEEKMSDKEDVVMSVRRTPSKPELNDPSSSYKPALSLLPSNYLHPDSKDSLRFASKPPVISLPSDGFGIRFIPLPSIPGKRKRYIATAEGLGQPLKIMRSVEEKMASENTPSVISLSASESSSKKSPSHSDPSEHPSSSSYSPISFNTEPSSTSKVLEWQQRLKASSSTEDSIDNIKIIHVTSLRHEVNDLPSSSSQSHSCSSQTLQKSQRNSLPCITNISSGSSIPKRFLPSFRSSYSGSESYSRHKEEITAHHIPESSSKVVKSPLNLKQSPRRFQSHENRPHSHAQYQGHKRETPPNSSTVGNNDGLSKRTFSNSNAIISSPKPSNKACVPNEQMESEIVISLSDSEDEVVPCQNVVKSMYQCSIPSLSQNCAPPAYDSSQNNGFHPRAPDQNQKRDILPHQKSGQPSKQRSIDYRCTVKHESPSSRTPTTFRHSHDAKSKPNSISCNINDKPFISSVKHSDKSRIGVAAAKESVIKIDLMEAEDEQSEIEIISDGEEPSPFTENCPVAYTESDTPHSHSENTKPHVAVVKPYLTQPSTDSSDLVDKSTEDTPDSSLTQEEKERMKEIFRPLILSSDIKEDVVEKAISENFAFFSVLITRGVRVNAIRKAVWTLFKASGKE